MSDPAIVDLARAHGLDIAIDLKGYTANARTELFAYRLAPIQMSYLGYLGTMGTSFIDYIIADKIVIPNDQRSNYSEKIAYLPHSYQINDNLSQHFRSPCWSLGTRPASRGFRILLFQQQL